MADARAPVVLKVGHTLNERFQALRQIAQIPQQKVGELRANLLRDRDKGALVADQGSMIFQTLSSFLSW
jgi:hypothetical protein